MLEACEAAAARTGARAARGPHGHSDVPPRGPGGGRVSPQRVLELTRHDRRRAVAATVARSVLSAVVVLVVYYLLPLTGGHPDAAALSRIAIGGLLFLAVMAYELRRILRADIPQLRAVEAVAIALPLFVVLFASAYVALAHSDPASFSEPVDRTSGLYFVVVTLGTVGYGDITPVTSFARILVTVQVLVDLAFLAVMVRVVIGAARISLQRTDEGQGDTGSDSADGGTGPGAGPEAGPGAAPGAAGGGPAG